MEGVRFSSILSHFYCIYRVACCVVGERGASAFNFIKISSKYHVFQVEMTISPAPLQLPIVKHMGRNRATWLAGSAEGTPRVETALLHRFWTWLRWGILHVYLYIVFVWSLRIHYIPPCTSFGQGFHSHLCYILPYAGFFMFPHNLP